MVVGRHPPPARSRGGLVVRVTLTNIKVALLQHKDETGESERKVAQSLDVHPYTLSLYATGKVTMPLERRMALAKYLGIPERSLIGETDFEVDA